MSLKEPQTPEERLEHVRQIANLSIEGAVAHVVGGTGNPKACLGSLAINASAHAIYSWFGGHDILGLKNWSYAAAKLYRMARQIRRDAPWINYNVVLPLLLSDHNDLISWFGRYGYDMECGRESHLPALVDRHKAIDFVFYHSSFAIEGRWDVLAERCERVLSDPPKSAQVRKYEIDHRFFLALARGDQPQMEAILEELTSPKVMRARLSDEGGFTASLISTPAVIYAKLARRNGFKVRVKSAYVPEEWLPVEPLPEYRDPYPFMRHFDIEQPLVDRKK